MARNVDDLALLLSVVSHPDDRDPLSSTPATSPEVIPIDSGEQLRVAFSPTLGGLAVETDVAEAVAAAASRIDADLGWAVTEDEPSFDGADETFLTLRAWLFANEASVGRRPDSELARAKQTVQDEVAKGRALDGRDVADAINELTRLQRGTLGFFDNYDVLVAPVTQLSPFPIELEYPQTLAGEPVERYIDWMMSCCRITALSVPALSLPIGLNEAGLPVGLHVIGRFGADEKVLRIAKTLEQLFAFEARPSILA